MDKITSEPVASQTSSARELKAFRRSAKIAARIKSKIKAIRDKFDLETELGRESLLQIKWKWDDILGRFAEEELRDEIELWAKSAGELLKRKEDKIEDLKFRIEEILEMQMRKDAMHLDQLEYLSKCHRVLRQSALDIFDLHTSKLVQDFVVIMNEKRSYLHKCNRDCENIAYARNELDKAIIIEGYECFMEDKYDRVCHEIEYRYKLKDATIQKMRCLQDKLLIFMKELEGDNLTVNKTERFLSHMKKERKLRKDSIRLDEAENICKRKLIDLNHELLNVEIERNSNLQGLQQEITYFMDIKSTLLGFVNRNKLRTHDKLLFDSFESYNVIKELEKIVKNGELLLSVVANCRKYETPEEKVMPFDDVDPVLSNTEFEMTTLDIKKFFQISEEDLLEEMQHLRKFYHRIAKVNHHNIILRNEKKELLAMREKYLQIIRSMHKSEDMKQIEKSLHVTSPKFNYV